MNGWSGQDNARHSQNGGVRKRPRLLTALGQTDLRPRSTESLLSGAKPMSASGAESPFILLIDGLETSVLYPG